MNLKKTILLLPLLILTACDPSTPQSSSVESSHDSSSESSEVVDTSTEESSVEESSEESSTDISSEDSSSDSSSEDSSVEPVPVEATVETAIAAIQKLQESDMLSYDYAYRRYQDNYITGAVYSNLIETSHVSSYTNGFIVDVETSQLTGVDTTEVTSSVSGRRVSYYYDDISYMDAYVEEGEDLSVNWAYIYEINRYKSPASSESLITSAVVSTVLSSLEDMNSVCPTEMGFTIEDVVIDVSDTSITYTSKATAEEEGYYAAEDAIYTLEIDLYTGDVISLSTLSRTYDIGSADRNNTEGTTNGLSIATLSNIVVGEKTEGEIPAVDPSSFTSITDYAHYEVQEVDEGVLSEETVLSIFANINAYMVGTVKDEYTITDTDYFDSTTFESVGEATMTGTATLYEGDYYEDVRTTVVASDSSTSTTTIINEAKDDGIHVTNSGNNYVVNGQYVTSMSSYFTPGPFGAGMTSACSPLVISETVTYGFGETDTGYSVITKTLTSAVKEGDTITISFSSDLTSDWMSSENDITLTIVDDFLTKVEGTQVSSSTINEVHNLTKGEPEARA